MALPGTRLVVDTGTRPALGAFVWMDITSNIIGILAALLTTVANVPQVIKCVRTGESADLSLKMLITLALGLLLWLSYGVMRSDFIIAAANGTSLCLVGLLLSFKWRDRNSQAAQTDDPQHLRR
jgi:MtN3 and saliva related transmembrane protein